MTRIASILAAGALACGLAQAAAHSENVTYIDGNLTGVTRHAAGALEYSGAEALELKAGLSTLAVPYAGISKAGLSAPQEHSSDVPLYKVWALHKHFSKTETQLLQVDFKDDQGESRTMTLELAKNAAGTVMNQIKRHNPSVDTATLLERPVTYDLASGPPKTEAEPKSEKPAEKESWWGDRYWKTNRNSEKWEKSSANAPE